MCSADVFPPVRLQLPATGLALALSIELIYLWLLHPPRNGNSGKALKVSLSLPRRQRETFRFDKFISEDF
jgi:hypothetical protein